LRSGVTLTMSLGSAACPLRPDIVKQLSRPDGLEQALDDLLCKVTQTIYRQTQFVCSPGSILISLVSMGRARRLSPVQERVIELEEIDVRENFPQLARLSSPGSLRGMYVYPPIGKIFLIKNRWCLETLIHEMLHSTSVFVERPDLRSRCDDLMNGLTEFYAGYLMYNHWRECYDAWKRETYDICSVTYSPFVKLWAAMCHFINIKELANIYFWLGHSNWEISFQGFVDRIHDLGYRRFRNILEIKKRIALRVYLEQECKDNFGRKFEQILGSRDECLDFSSMLT
jgi:hypothetical protein